MTNLNSVPFANTNSDFSSHHDEIGEICISNISPEERKKRAWFAVRQLVITLFVLGALVVFDVNPLWRLLLFFMFSAATTSYIQALDKT